MSTPNLGPRLNYLTNAAHLLALSTPETSAYIMSQRNDLARRNDVKMPTAQARHVCGACGHIFLPSQGSSIEPTRLRKVSKSSAAKGEGAKEVVERRFTCRCGRCGRFTDISRPGPSKPPTRRLKNNAVHPPTPTPAPTSTSATFMGTKRDAREVRAKPSASASSRKRAKNRKAGLQALIQQNKPGSSSGFGLSLSDFIK